jgi:hypothetical protein
MEAETSPHKILIQDRDRESTFLAIMKYSSVKCMHGLIYLSGILRIVVAGVLARKGKNSYNACMGYGKGTD